MAASPPKLLGSTTPRLWTQPLRPLNRRTSLGYECSDFQDIAGTPYLPWQRWATIHALELNPDRSFRFRIVLIIVARQNGKSHLKRGETLWRMFMFPRTRVLGVAQEVRLAREQWGFCQETIHACPDLAAEWAGVRNVNGDEYFTLTNGSRYAIGAASRRSGRGSSNDEVDLDELREQRNWDAWAALSKTTMARPNSQIWCMSNAGDDQSVVLNQLREAALAERDPTIGIFEWSAPDGCDLDDPRAWAQANPGLGYTISEAAIRSALATDPPAIFRTEVLCQRVENLDCAIDPAAWRDCGDATGTLDTSRERLAACFDMAPDGQHATLLVAARQPDGRVRVEVAAAWTNSDAARTEIGDWLTKLKPAQFGWYPGGPASAFGPMLRDHATRINRHPGGKRLPTEIPEDGALAGTRVTEACQSLADLVRGRQIIHAGQDLLTAHIIGASKLPSGDGWRFTRKGGHVDAAYTAAGAVQIVLTMPAPRKASIRIVG